MKAVIASIQPKFCWLIEKRLKPWELRTTLPKLDVPFKCYIYCTLNGSREFFTEQLNGDVTEWNRGKWFAKKGSIIGEFVCDRIETAVTYGGTGPICNQTIIEASGLTRKEVLAYSKGKTVYAWHISDLNIYEEPKELNDFCKPCPKDHECSMCDYFFPGIVDYDACEPPYCSYWESAASMLHRVPQSWCYVEELPE